MINSFQVGAVVTGNSFIGRKELVKQYRKQFLTKSKSSSVSIIGITRVGKTSFIKKVFDKIPETIIYSYTDLKESSSYQELWQSILMPIQEYLEKNTLITKELLEDFFKIENEELPWIKLRSIVKRIFLYLGEKQLKSIIVLDEFDYASVLFNSETKKYELFRSVISSPDYNLAAILISRRNLHDIEGQTFQSSTFRGVFDTRYFKGFNEEDLQEYYKVFENKNISLSDKSKEEIKYYAGNSPYLLSIIGNRILDRRKNLKDIDISDIFNNDCRQINDYYSDVIKHLERDNSKDRLVSFVLGPNIGITKADVEELINLGYIQNINNDYIPISKYFEDYLRNHKLNESIWERITSTERKIKLIIEAEEESLKKSYGIISQDKNVVQKEILKNTKGIEESDFKKLDSFIRSNKRDFKVDSTYFDVMSLSDSFKIIVSHWTLFCKYFNNDLLSNWEQKFRIIGTARNAPAHAHEEYLSDSIKRDVDNYCSDIQQLISRSYGFKDVSNNKNDYDGNNKNLTKSSSKQTPIKNKGVVIEKINGSIKNLFVREDVTGKEYFIYKGNSQLYVQLKSGVRIEFELKSFSAPNKPNVLFAVNYAIQSDSAIELNTKFFSGTIIEEKIDSKGNKYFLIERENAYPIKLFPNRNPIEYYNHSVGDNVFYTIEKTQSKDGKIYESAILVSDESIEVQ